MLSIGILNPYRPKTIGNVERFWRTIADNLLGDTYFESKEHLEKELHEYLYYYNDKRPHVGIDRKTSFSIKKICQRNN